MRRAGVVGVRRGTDDDDGGGGRARRGDRERARVRSTRCETRRDATRRDGDDGRGVVREANLRDAPFAPFAPFERVVRREGRRRRRRRSIGRTIDRWDGMGWGPPGSRTVEIPLETSPEGRRRTTERAGSTTRMNERWRSEK
jgi:hypothetical protein